MSAAASSTIYGARYPRRQRSRRVASPASRMRSGVGQAWKSPIGSPSSASREIILTACDHWTLVRADGFDELLPHGGAAQKAASAEIRKRGQVFVAAAEVVKARDYRLVQLEHLPDVGPQSLPGRVRGLAREVGFDLERSAPRLSDVDDQRLGARISHHAGQRLPLGVPVERRALIPAVRIHDRQEAEVVGRPHGHLCHVRRLPVGKPMSGPRRSGPAT